MSRKGNRKASALNFLKNLQVGSEKKESKLTDAPLAAAAASAEADGDLRTAAEATASTAFPIPLVPAPSKLSRSATDPELPPRGTSTPSQPILKVVTPAPSGSQRTDKARDFLLNISLSQKNALVAFKDVPPKSADNLYAPQPKGADPSSNTPSAPDSPLSSLSTSLTSLQNYWPSTMEFGQRKPAPLRNHRGKSRALDKSIYLHTSSGSFVTLFTVLRNGRKRCRTTPGWNREDSVGPDPAGVYNSGATPSKGISYANLLTVDTWDEPDPELLELSKDSSYLDDPEIRTGRHRTVLNLPSYMQSVIPFVKPKEMKEELNEQLRQKHPWLNPQVTLSKIRNIKKDLFNITQAYNLELSTVALACIYVERLVVKGRLTKPNRKLTAAACLLLAAKFNQGLGDGNQVQGAPSFTAECLEKQSFINVKDVASVEFQVFADLNFSLYVDHHEIYFHVIRLLNDADRSPLEYFGEEMMAICHFFFDENEAQRHRESDPEMLQAPS